MKNQCDGQIRFERTKNKSLAMRQGWNPSNLTLDERETIADELEQIARNIRCGLFEDKKEIVRFETKKN